LGDSITEGIQVPVEQTFGKLAEKQLNAKLRRPIQVINFGNSGYSTVQEYLLLKEKVLRYKPDLVVLNYSSRDMFENWTAPDATITNLRPIALALPGKPLVVENESVKHWMRGTRGRIMVETQWIRQHSRIWGLITATQTQLSISDPFYKGLVAFFSNPVKSIKDGIESAKHFNLSQIKLPDMSAPSFKIKFFENKQTALRQALAESSVTSAPKSAPNFQFVTMPQLHKKGTAKTKPSGPSISTTSDATAEQKTKVDTPAAQAEITRNAAPSDKAQDANASVAPDKAKNGNETYVALMSHTLHALLEAMQAECQSHGIKFAVCLLPSRAQLSPAPGVETNFFNITYRDEERYVTESCKKLDIPLFDAEQAAESALPDADRPNYFYLMHFNAKGHEFFAKQVTPFLAGLVPPANPAQ
jgi:lysophospholipase L1-like esterase